MKWQTRDGRPYQEAGINPDARLGHERIGWVQERDGTWQAVSHKLDGSSGFPGVPTRLDLVPVPETVERWIVAWCDKDSYDQFGVFEHEADARDYADRLRRHQFPLLPKWVADPIRVEWTLPTEETKT